MKKKYPEITMLRGMAILMVLLYHSILVFPINLHAIEWCKRLHTLLWYVEMPLFFLVSGFCYSYKGNYGQYFLKKVKRILIPHFVFGMLDMTLRVLPSYIPELKDMVNQKLTFTEGIKAFLIYGGEDIFLRSLFLIAVIFPIIAWFMERNRVTKWITYIGVFGLYILQREKPIEFVLGYISSFMVFYVAGYSLRQGPYMKIKEVLKRPQSMLAGVLILVLGFCFMCKGELEGIAIGVLGEMAIAVAGAGVCFYVAVHVKGTINKIFTTAGEISLPLYLMGSYVLVVTRMILVGKLGVDIPVLIILCNFVVDFCVLWFIICKVIMPCKFLCLLCGMEYQEKTRR